MASFLCKAMPIVVIIIVALHEGCGIPLSSQKSGSPGESVTQHRTRVKRCSCNDWEDKECIYFCHLDIIWVNTPGKLLPYGLGNPSRRRRSTRRCQCLNPFDPVCTSFCSHSSENDQMEDVKMEKKSPNLSSNKILQSLRSVVKSNSKRRPSKQHHTKVQQETSTKR